jgi:pimeloyl-ACP methyl ester carboxylesterase
MSSYQSGSPDTIVLIHGLWMSPLSWEKWIGRYDALGYRVLAPAWPGEPGLDEDIDEFRADPSAVDKLGMEEIIDHYDGIVRDLDSPPIIMGHSFGGAFAEVLLDRGLGAAGVAIDAAAVRGVTQTPFSQLKVGFPVLQNPANNHRAFTLTFDQFCYGFANTMTEEAAREAYERYAVPGPGRVLFQGVFANLNPHTPAKVDFGRADRAPLLLIGGEFDHTAPAVVDRSMAKHYEKSPAVTEYKEFPRRSHFIIGQDGWEEVADYALRWAIDHAAVPASTG